jgi:hypothetical protein
MIPLYFPYTYITRQTALELSVFFESFVVFRPSDDPLPDEMRALADCGLLDVQVPDFAEPSRFKDVFNNFQRWGYQQHNKDEIQAAVLRSRTNPLPVYDEQSTSRITADLRRQLEPSGTDDSVDTTLEARVFLAFAQEFDREHQEISGDLGTYQDKVRHMLAGINAEGNNPLQEPLSELGDRQRDFADYMLPERVHAWLRLNGKTPADTGILLTTNSNVLEYLSTRISVLKKIHEFSSVAVSAVKDENHAIWQENLLQYLIELTRDQDTAQSKQPPELSQPTDHQASLSMSVYLIAKLALRDCLARCISPTVPDAGSSTVPSRKCNTVIGLIQSSETSK